MTTKEIDDCLDELDGREIMPGIFLIGAPKMRPDLGEHKAVGLANYHGTLATIELSIKVLKK